MLPNDTKGIGRKKVVWGLGQLLPHLKRTIDTSRFIPTDEKDSLYQRIEDTYQQLEDAIKREFGAVPITPAKEKQWKDNINKMRRKLGKEPLPE